VYNTQNYWGFGLFPLSGSLETRKWVGEDTYSVGSLRKSKDHLRMETDPVSETSCFLVSRIPDDGKSPKTQ
jgi:hypothetical protein